MTDGTRDRWICHGCIEDRFLKKEVRTGGKRAKCSYCGTMRKSLPLEWLANRTHDVLVQHFNPTTERSGDAVGYVIQYIAEVDEPIAEDVRKYLSDLHDDEGENPYGDDAYYEARGADGRYLRETWERFCRQIQFRSRFFSPRQALDEIFRDIGTLRTWRDIPVIREIGPEDQNRYIFRARKALSERELGKILSVPEKELGSPPSRLATALRMNAAGVSVFYGASDEETCIAEVRAPVGGYVIIGRFEIIRPVRLLDVVALAQVIAGSHFDAEFRTHNDRAAFLRSFVGEISAPVMPGDEEFEYLPTQVVSEYLASCVNPRLDGLVFPSSQTGGHGCNIVLFNHARRVEPYDRPGGAKLFISLGQGNEDDYDDGVTIHEFIGPPENAPEPVEFVPRSDLVLEVPNQNRDDDLEYRDDPTLRLDVEGTRVLKIEAVRYKYRERDVNRYPAPPRFEGA